MRKSYTTVGDLIKMAGIIDSITSIPGKIKDKVFIPAGNSSESLSERIGYTLGEFMYKPEEDNDDLGPYKDVVQHIKDTEIAEAYLREAATMRRKARILRRKKEEAENLRGEIAGARFF